MKKQNMLLIWRYVSNYIIYYNNCQYINVLMNLGNYQRNKVEVIKDRIKVVENTAEAAKIRAIRPPEPYKGKGIKYEGEQIIRKAGKSGKA